MLLAKDDYGTSPRRLSYVDCRNVCWLFSSVICSYLSVFAPSLFDCRIADGMTIGLHKVTDKEGKTAVDHAKEEGNHDVAKVIEEAETLDLGDGAAGEGLRKRK